MGLISIFDCKVDDEELNQGFVYVGDFIKVGNQFWSRENYKFAYPGSKVYGGDENNRNVYGGLYTWAMVMSGDFCPVGCHIPSYNEWITLSVFLGSDFVCGGYMKESGFDHWNSPNTGANNSSGLAMRGGGYYEDVYKQSLELKQSMYLWLSSSVDSVRASSGYLRYNDSIELNLSLDKLLFCSVRFIKD